jgi:hypothetical protein
MKRVAYLVLLHLSLSGASFWPLWGSSPQPQPQAKLVQLAELTSVVQEQLAELQAAGNVSLAPSREWRRDVIVNFFAVSARAPRPLTNLGWFVPHGRQGFRLALSDNSQVHILVVSYKSVNSRAGKSLLSPNW